VFCHARWIVLPAALGPPGTSVVIRCSRTPRGVQLAFSGGIAGKFDFTTAVEAELEVSDWLEVNLNGRLVELHSGSRLVGVAEKPPMAKALLGRALRLL
jgi:hypothetical protein